MIKKFNLNYIPAILYGEPSDKVYMYVHRRKGCKEDAQRFYEIVKEDGWQVLSIDLPGCGEREESREKMTPWVVSPELTLLYSYAREHWKKVGLRADGLGAYFSLVSCQLKRFDKVLFVSPIVDMAEHIDGLMAEREVQQDELKALGNIEISKNLVLTWDYFLYAHDYPITVWDSPTEIICTTKETLFNQKVLEAFVDRFGCNVTIEQDCSYWFNESGEDDILRKWVREKSKLDEER